MCLLYAASVLVVTAVWVYMARDKPFGHLARAMFFPGAMAVMAAILDGNLFQFVLTAFGIRSPLLSIAYSLVSVASVYGMVGACYAVAYGFNWGKPAKMLKAPPAIHEHNRYHLESFLRAAGEEVGWRCFLLPCLMSIYRPVYAMLIGGIVWGLYHVPIMVLLSSKRKVDRPYLTVFMQCASCVLAAYPHSWVTIKSGYSLWPSSVMHAGWNFLNPLVLGSIYTQAPGRLVGPQWLINGEGLTGCIVNGVIAVFTVWELQNPDYLNNLLAI